MIFLKTIFCLKILIFAFFLAKKFFKQFFEQKIEFLMIFELKIGNFIVCSIYFVVCSLSTSINHFHIFPGITAFSVPTVVTKMTKSEAEMLKKESKWQKNVLRVMIDNPFSSHSHAIFAALKQISPQVHFDYKLHFLQEKIRKMKKIGNKKT